MANPIKQLAKLNAKTQSFDDGRGGVPDLTPLDIAAGLAGLPKIYQEYAYIRFVMPPPSKKTLCERAKDKGQASIAVRYESASEFNLGWFREQLKQHVEQTLHLKAQRSRTFDLAVTLALDEQINPNLTLCQRCNGTGVKEYGGPACKSCRGNGAVRLTDAQRAKRLEVDKSNFTRKWRVEYSKIFGVLQDMDDRIYRHLKRRLNTG